MNTITLKLSDLNNIKSVSELKKLVEKETIKQQRDICQLFIDLIVDIQDNYYKDGQLNYYGCQDLSRVLLSIKYDKNDCADLIFQSINDTSLINEVIKAHIDYWKIKGHDLYCKNVISHCQY